MYLRRIDLEDNTGLPDNSKAHGIPEIMQDIHVYIGHINRKIIKILVVVATNGFEAFVTR